MSDFWGDDLPEEPDWIDPQSDMMRQIIDEYGAEFIEGIIVDWSQVKRNDVRGAVFAALDDALAYIYDIGVLSFSNVSIDPDGLVRVAIPDTTPELPL